MADILSRLANLDANRAQLNDLVVMSAEAKIVRAEFETHDVPTPEQLTEGIRTLSREIHSRQADTIERRLREIDQQDAADKTQSERREERRAEKERLKAKLGIKDETPVSA